MKDRVITTALYLLVFLPILFIGGSSFNLFVLWLALVSYHELMKMFKISLLTIEGMLSQILILSAVVPIDFLKPYTLDLIFVGIFLLGMVAILRPERFNFAMIATLTLSALYVGAGFRYLMEVRNIGIFYVLYVLIVASSTDTVAFLFGSRFGKRKLAPMISPNKTIEGAVAGVIAAALVSTLFVRVFGSSPMSNWSMIVLLLIGGGISIIGQFGDLFESSIKRYYSVKDSGHILRNQGGILDRFDNFLFAIVAFHFLMVVTGITSF